MSNAKIASISNLLQQHRSFLLVPHGREDGDACGSMMALGQALRALGKQVHTILLTPPSPRYVFLFESQPCPVLGHTCRVQDLPPVDAVVVLDTSAREQLPGLLDWLDHFSGTVIVIDHHAQSDLRFDAAWIDERSPATGLLVAQIIEHLGQLDNPVIAEYLLIALAADTGWFRYDNTSVACFEWAARFAKIGVSLRTTYEKLFLADPPARFLLICRALGSAELFADGQAVVLTVTRKDFDETGACDAHTENIVDETMRLQTMRVAILFVEAPDNVVRISLRSRTSFDVARFARRFGGGGHRQAAGVRLTGPIGKVKDKVLSTLLSELQTGT